MGVVAERELLIRNLVRLRRAQARQPDSDELPAVRADLEALVGASVPRAFAARVLGVSRAALDKRIARGDVPVVLTRDGRREVAVSMLVDLADAVEQVERPTGARSALGAVLDRQRADAQTLALDDLLPAVHLAERDAHPHRRAELRSLAYHRVVARKLTPGLVADARQRLARWREQGRIHPNYAAAWERLLGQPLPVIAAAVTADDQASRDLRQNSPFAGALTAAERERAQAAVDR